MNAIGRAGLRVASRTFPERLRAWLLHLLTRHLRKQLRDELTDGFLELLLRGMDLWFLLSHDYRRNILGFRGVCVFRTRDEGVAVSVVFENGHMHVEHAARPAFDCRVTFKDSEALWSFLLSENQDILDSILANTIELEGNVTYVYRFGFLAKELTLKLEPRLAAA